MIFRYKIIFVVLISVIHTRLFSASIGFSTGGTFQSFYYNGKNHSKEISSFGADVNIQGFFSPHARVLLIPELGYSYHSDFNTSYVGLKTGFVLYPKYHPFIGFTLREHFYDRTLTSKNQFLTSLYFSSGGQIFNHKHHSIWIFVDYLVIQSKYRQMLSSKMSLNIGYSYSFK